MNFIFSLAHFCEVHGPTSILCTQLLPPSCLVCTSSSPTVFNPESLSTPIPTPPSRACSTRSLNISSRHPSPAITPPLSPQLTHTIPNGSCPIVPSLPSSGSSSSSDSCANCSLTLPKNLSDRLPVKDGKKVLVIRSREAVVTGCMVQSKEWQDVADQNIASAKSQKHKRRQSTVYQSTTSGDFESNLLQRRRSVSSASSTSSNADFPCTISNVSTEDEDTKMRPISPHTHNITYLSTRFPSLPSRFSALRRACVRTLSCESLPTQTGPIFVGDSDTGYTIAYVFRLSDPKARGGRRTYALLCLCPEVKKIVSSYGYVTSVFEGLVARIKELAKIAARPPSSGTESGNPQPNNSPEGFLRRPPRVNAGKDLAELVGREQLFVEVHACFSTLLGGLARRFGCLEESEGVGNIGLPPSVQGTGYTTGGLTANERERLNMAKLKISNGRSEELRREMFV